jgi:hypothetical protein
MIYRKGIEFAFITDIMYRYVSTKLGTGGRRMYRKLTILLMVLIGYCGIAQGATYYVSKTGNDTNTGRSWGAAWATVTKVNTSVVHGDTVRFGSGRWLKSMLTPATGGTFSSRTLYACSTLTTATQGFTIAIFLIVWYRTIP